MPAALQFLQIAAGTEHEHAAVPVGIAALHIFFSGLPVGLFLEPADDKAAVGKLLAAQYLTMPRLVTVRHDAESDELSRLGQRHGFLTLS
jgi:hypothetical protein